MVDKKPPNQALSTRTAPSRDVGLHETGQGAGGLIGRAIQELSPEESKAVREDAIRAAIELEVQQRKQEIEYVGGKKVVEDHVEAWQMLDQGKKMTRHTVTTETEMGAGKMRIESKSGAQCFVATAAYGDATHPDVIFLRCYRDQVLATSPIGRLFIRVYWFVGPKLASMVAPFPVLQQAARRLLKKLVIRLNGRHSL